MISNNQISKVICIACQDTIKNHSKRQLWRCLFRIQGTMVGDKLDEKPPKIHTPNLVGDDKPSSI